MIVQPGHGQLDLRGGSKVSGQHGLPETSAVQTADRLPRTRVCRLVPGQLGAPGNHDLREDVSESGDSRLCHAAVDPRTDGGVDDDGLVGVAVHLRVREDDSRLRQVVRLGDGSSQPAKVRGDERPVDVPQHQVGLPGRHACIIAPRPVRTADACCIPSIDVD
jgi:hypothetical protein